MTKMRTIHEAMALSEIGDKLVMVRTSRPYHRNKGLIDVFDHVETIHPDLSFKQGDRVRSISDPMGKKTGTVLAVHDAALWVSVDGEDEQTWELRATEHLVG